MRLLPTNAEGQQRKIDQPIIRRPHKKTELQPEFISRLEQINREYAGRYLSHVFKPQINQSKWCSNFISGGRTGLRRAGCLNMTWLLAFVTDPFRGWLRGAVAAQMADLAT